MSFFLAILPLAVVFVLMVPAMAAGGAHPATTPRAPRVKAPRTKAGSMLDGASLRGLY